MVTTPKAAWRGYIHLGQLGIPVRLYTAIRPIRPHFVQLHEMDGSPVERELRCRTEGRKIPLDEVVRAIEYEPGHYIPITDGELAGATHEPNKSVVVRQFCEVGTVSSIYADRPFYVVSARGGERAYALLREVLGRQRKVAIAQFAIYSQEHLAMLTSLGDLLVLQQLHFAAEMVPRHTIKTPALPKPSPAEVDVLSAVVERFSGPFYPEDYHDEYAERVIGLIERKAKGLPVPRSERIAPRATPEGEIVTALENTLGNAPSISNTGGRIASGLA